MRKPYIWIIFLILLSFALSFYFYPQMPEKIASHWDAQGQVNGYMGKTAAILLIPCTLVFLAIIFLLIPAIDPLKENIAKFQRYYYNFILLFFLFMLIVHLQMILWNVGIKISPNLVLPITLGILFYYIGIMVEQSKRNYFIGIRTPWTLHDDEIWDKTHEVGGKSFKIGGVICALGVLNQRYAIYFVLSIIPFAFYPALYSYICYWKKKRKTEGGK